MTTPYDPDRHHRRSIRLPGYDYRQAGAYFITICTRGRECVLSDPTVSGIIHEVWQSLPAWFPTITLDEFVVMPNHVHLVLTPLEQPDGEWYPLSRILHTMKGYSGRQANRVLGREGAFWQHESYDRYVRNEEELGRIIAYVVNNPVKAGLASTWTEWPWTWSKYEL